TGGPKRAALKTLNRAIDSAHETVAPRVLDHAHRVRVIVAISTIPASRPAVVLLEKKFGEPVESPIRNPHRQPSVRFQMIEPQDEIIEIAFVATIGVGLGQPLDPRAI